MSDYKQPNAKMKGEIDLDRFSLHTPGDQALLQVSKLVNPPSEDVQPRLGEAMPTQQTSTIADECRSDSKHVDPHTHPRLWKYLEGFRNNHRTPLMSFYPGLTPSAWHDPQRFPLARALAAHYDTIRAEALALADQHFHDESERIGRTGAWKVFLLHELGRKNVFNTSRCPVTASLVEEHSTVRTLAGLIYFSRMAPGTHIQAHHGPTNLRLRCHLGIRVPTGDCALRVGNETRRWKEGKCIVFDDYFEHEAWNRTDEERIVLIVDIWHPDLTAGEIEMLEGLHRYALQHAKHLNAYWMRNAKVRSSAIQFFD